LGGAAAGGAIPARSPAGAGRRLRRRPGQSDDYLPPRGQPGPGPGTGPPQSRAKPMTPSPPTIEGLLPDHRRARPRLSKQPPAEPQPPRPTGRVPRVSRLMALALRFQGLLQQGLIADYATLACLGHVSRARVTQIMNLAVLAPDIQEMLLFLP